MTFLEDLSANWSEYSITEVAKYVFMHQKNVKDEAEGCSTKV